MLRYCTGGTADFAGACRALDMRYRGYRGCRERLYDQAMAKGYSVQIWLSMNAVNWDLDSAPTLVASTEPFLNNISVGMPRMPYLGGVA